MRYQITNLFRNVTWKDYLYYSILIVLGVVGIYLIRYATPSGLGLVNDSVGYIGGARNILAGNGYSRLKGDYTTTPFTNYPPFFSITLAVVGFTGLEIIRSSRLVVLLCYSANIILVGIISRKITRSYFWGLLGVFLFIASEPFIRIHTFALSEPLYLSLCFLVLFFLIRHLEKPHWIWLAVAGVLSSLVFLTRYLGISLYITAILTLIVFRQKWNWRLKDSLTYLIFGTPAIFAWILRNILITGNPANRALLFHPVSEDKFRDGIQTFWNWLFPDEFVTVHDWSTSLGILLIIIISAITIWVLVNGRKIWRRELHLAQNPVLVLGLHGIIYLGVLILTLTVLDSSPVFEDRILSPFFISVLFICLYMLSWLWGCPTRAAKLAAFPLYLILFFSLGTDSLGALDQLHQDGQGYINYSWRISPTIAAVSELPDIVLYSNKPNALYILANKPAFILTSPNNPATGQIRPNYQENMARIKQRVLDKEAVLVVFDYHYFVEDPDNPDFLWILDLTKGLNQIGDYNDGVIFGYIE